MARPIPVWSGRMTGLTALPIPQEPASAWIDGIALSPDGSELAVADDRTVADDEPAIQVFSLAKLRSVTPNGVEFRSHLDGSKHLFTPEHSIAVQIALGADIIMAFDECVETPATWERTKESMALTHAWAARSKQHFAAPSVSNFVSSSRIRSAETWVISGERFFIAADVSTSIANPSRAAKRTARSMRNLSSRKRRAGSPMARIIPASRSASPPT